MSSCVPSIDSDSTHTFYMQYVFTHNALRYYAKRYISDKEWFAYWMLPTSDGLIITSWNMLIR